jgi:hypothetical protein
VLLENIRLNSIETTIFPINAGLASRPGKILLEEVDIETTNVTYHRPKDQKGAIPAVTHGYIECIEKHRNKSLALNYDFKLGDSI